MSFKKIAAALMAAAVLAGAVSCEEKDPAKTAVVGENGVSDIIRPAESSEEYKLGEYRVSEKGIKLYYDDEIYSPEIILTMEKYFNSFAENDFDAYKSLIYPDYAERYNEYLNKEYNYSLDGSFELRLNSLHDTMIDQVKYAATEDADFTGDFKVTRIKIEPVELGEDETEESMIGSFFQTYDSIFNVDYYDVVSKDADSLMVFCFYVFAEGEDGNEYALINGDTHNQGPKVVLAEKNGCYYTFG